MLELRGLRGKSGPKLKLMLQRVDQETREFERCTARLAAMRAVHARMLRDTLAVLSSDRLRDEVGAMQKEIAESFFKLGAKKAFLSLCERLRAMLDEARRRSDEIREMLSASYQQLNTEFGFALALSKPPGLERYARDLELIARNYSQYLGLSQALKLSEPRFLEQFRRMLLSKLRVAFENAASEIELWNKSASAQIDSQLRERRRGFKRRREALERIETASSELEQRIGELEAQDQRDQLLLARVQALAADVQRLAETEVPLDDDEAPAREAPALTLVAARRA
jgi:uncharacterized small protein (DUF1192 family)